MPENINSISGNFQLTNINQTEIKETEEAEISIFGNDEIQEPNLLIQIYPLPTVVYPETDGSTQSLIERFGTEPEYEFTNPLPDGITAEQFVNEYAKDYDGLAYNSGTTDSVNMSRWTGSEEVESKLKDLGIDPEAEGFEEHTELDEDGHEYTYYSKINEDGSVDYLKLVTADIYSSLGEQATKLVYSKYDPEANTMTTKLYDCEDLANDKQQYEKDNKQYPKGYEPPETFTLPYFPGSDDGTELIPLNSEITLD